MFNNIFNELLVTMYEHCIIIIIFDAPECVILLYLKLVFWAMKEYCLKKCFSEFYILKGDR